MSGRTSPPHKLGPTHPQLPDPSPAPPVGIPKKTSFPENVHQADETQVGKSESKQIPTMHNGNVLYS
ncbi:hypothetical protein M8J76_002674 [Diaphorina citri]|nr:hypothetical protein M8J76_002674 [Diaphorina citri]